MADAEITGRIRHHTREQCDTTSEGLTGCPFHAPSLHPMIEEPMVLRASGLIERMCIHGIGHPDPDSVAWMHWRGGGSWDIHGCDGCCYLPEILHSDSEVRPDGEP